MYWELHKRGKITSKEVKSFIKNFGLKVDENSCMDMWKEFQMGIQSVDSIWETGPLQSPQM